MNTANSALLLVDVQQDFFNRDGLSPPATEIIAGLANLLAGWRQTGRPVLHVRTRIQADGNDRMPHWQANDTRACVAGTPGYEPPAELAARPDEPVLHKRFFSAFDAPGLAAELARREIDTLVIAGLYTHGCIRASVLDAYVRGLNVLVADDAIGSTEPLHAELSRDWLAGRAAQFLPTEMILAGGTSAGEDIAEVAERCAATARQAASWAATEPAARADVLERWADQLEAQSPALIELLAKEIGKPASDGADELRRTLAHIRAAANIARSGLERSLEDGARVRYRPVGAIGLITPWNNPLAIAAGKLAPALAFGNTCVWKPSPRAPQCSQRLMETLLDSGLPAGVLAHISGQADVARAIAASPHIDAISLTGSNAAGQAIAALCAARGKPLQAELGGNNAALILDDWDGNAADVALLARWAFRFAGQRCTAIRRFIVQRGVLARFSQLMIAAVAELVVGDPLAANTQVGPLINRSHRDGLVAKLNAALGDGARILAQASLPSDTDTGRWAGHWFAPTLLTDVDANAEIAQQESFGPIALLLPADDLEQAIAIANGVPQGLIAAVYSANAETRREVADRLQAGMLKLGPGPMAISADAPFCGWKASAMGPPEHGIWDRDFYARIQTVYT